MDSTQGNWAPMPPLKVRTPAALTPYQANSGKETTQQTMSWYQIPEMPNN